MLLTACAGTQPAVLNADAISNAAERSVASVVNISSRRVVQQRSGFIGVPTRATEEQSLGSGVIMNREGVVLTNHHVVQQASEISVTLHDGRTLGASILGSDRETDIAVLKLQASAAELQELTPITVGDSTQLMIGEIVLAIGNPFGIGQTVTMGIVSALGRAGMGINQYESYIQTDAAINPGNSGGALVNLDGSLIGINTAIASRTGNYSGVGFAIPSSMALALMRRLVSDGKIVRGFLGVRVEELNAKVAQQLGITQLQGALVNAVVEGSPAHHAGVLPNDVVVRFNGDAVTSPQHLHNLIATSGAGGAFTIEVRRNGELVTLSGALSAEPNTPIAGTT